MKRSTEAARLITADNPEWAPAELPASRHSVISRMCPQKVPRQHCRSPAPRAPCLPPSLWGLLKPFFSLCTGLVLNTAAISSAACLQQSWDTRWRGAEPICWLISHLLLLGRTTTKVSVGCFFFFFVVVVFWWSAWTSPPCPYFNSLLLFLFCFVFFPAAGGRFRLEQNQFDPFIWVIPTSGNSQVAGVSNWAVFES